ncbi:MAG TPA: RecX family transcriptional regulator [Acetobacteraceae bacterium]|nr:RecX family transcriptional regulator [Acetobacteraceae bacterium]
MARPTTPRMPDEASLHEAALAHLARYGTTEAGLIRVLERRVLRWARAQEGADPAELAAQVAAGRRAARAVAARLVAAGAVNDAAFAEARARRLARAGRSRRAVLAHLAARGVEDAAARQVVPEDAEAEFAAALAFARRRRIGPFGAPSSMGDDPARRQKEAAAFARAGFGETVARRAFAMEPEEAAALLAAWKRA